ncbi:hypothetical protein QA597_04235 [Marinilabiliaceae bacterium ANBcel2]|nr:hypothetical protein [Marinilabiliaceae bacterium ANBcel2]
MNFVCLSAAYNRCAFFILFFLPLHTLFCENRFFFTPSDILTGKNGAISDEVWGLHLNPAGDSFVQSSIVGAGHYLDFFVEDYTSNTMFFKTPLNPGVVSFGLTQSGVNAFKSEQLSLSFSRRLSQGFRGGVRFNYSRRQQMGVTISSLITLDAGFQVNPGDLACVGFYIINSARSSWDYDMGESDSGPFIMGGSIRYELPGEVFLESGVSSTEESPFSFSFSVEASLYNSLKVNAGISHNPLLYGVGTSFLWRGLLFDNAISYHTVLGFSSSFGVVCYISDFDLF